MCQNGGLPRRAVPKAHPMRIIDASRNCQARVSRRPAPPKARFRTVQREETREARPWVLRRRCQQQRPFQRVGGAHRDDEQVPSGGPRGILGTERKETTMAGQISEYKALETSPQVRADATHAAPALRSQLQETRGGREAPDLSTPAEQSQLRSHPTSRSCAQGKGTGSACQQSPPRLPGAANR